MGSLQDLLPDSASSVLCSDFSRSLGLDPGGTAIRADRIVLIETPLPWPKPVFEHPLLNGVKEILDQSATITRVLASTASEADTTNAATDGRVSVNVFDRGISDNEQETNLSAVEQYRFELMPNDLPAFSEILAAHSIGAKPSPELLETLKYQGPVESPILIVCTQGSHDICCGSKGMRFANEVDAIEDVTVYKVSHTGGHRFAPTAMTLPDGRMWADLTVDKLEKILMKSVDVAEVVGDCRGWWGAERGAAQVAERAVWAQVGWSLDATDRSVALESEAGQDEPSGAQRWRVRAEGHQWEVTVSAGREVPTITCHSPGGLPAKSSIEYQVDGLRALDRSFD